MRILVAGSGGREHALAWACARRGAEIICAPGNGGTATIAENVDVAADDVENIVRLARERGVDLVVIGPDAAVAAGLADACAAAGIAAFGPTRAAGRIESSKEFAKQLMDSAGIPTARWRAGGAGQREALLAFVDELGGACAVKADGLALGKGVTVCDDAAQARAAIDACLLDGRFGHAGARVVVEERLTGREVSVLALSDGERLRVLVPACDHKRAHDGDRGPNTGGMGAYAPVGWLDGDALRTQAVEQVLQPCVDALSERGTPYRGCLYTGLIVTASGLRVLEFNARFGDPEAQVLLPLLVDDAPTMFAACVHGELVAGDVAVAAGASVGVVAAAEGYPGSVRKGDAIEGVDEVEDDVLVFHAGTARGADGVLRTAGGRVLTVVSHKATLESARRHVYANLDRIRFAGSWYRSDIAAPAALTVPAR
jgi:phosphoribosylamine--glycine ligase